MQSQDLRHGIANQGERERERESLTALSRDRDDTHSQHTVSAPVLVHTVSKSRCMHRKCMQIDLSTQFMEERERDFRPLEQHWFIPRSTLADSESWCGYVLPLRPFAN